MIYIGLGGNVGDVLERFRLARIELESVASAPLYRSKAIGPEQADYLNSAIAIADEWEPSQLLVKCQQLELRLGRVRRERWGPRTIDLDILWWDGRVVDEPELTVPHPRLRERAFAMLPLIALGVPLDGVPGLAIDQDCELVGSW